MDVSLTFCLCPHGAMIFPGPLWPNQWAYFKPQGVIWKIWISSFQRYLLLYCGLSGLVTANCQSKVFLAFFRKSKFFTLCWNFLFENFFPKCSHLNATGFKCMKPTATNNPKFYIQVETLRIFSHFWVILVWSVGPQREALKRSDMSISSSLFLYLY